MKITKILLIILCLLTFHTHPKESLNQKSLWSKAISSIAQSYPMYWIEKKIGEKFYGKMMELSGLDNGPATPYYQALGKEALSAVGIPEEYHVPIKKMSPTNPLAQIVAGFTVPSAIYVNEKKLNEQSYGVQRCAVYHEAIHKKYNDISFDNIVEWPILLGAGYATHKLLQIIKPRITPDIIHGIIVVASALTIVTKTGQEYHLYIEQRADIEGCYATQCAACVQEAATHRHKRFEEENHPFKNNGYLQADEMEIIARDLRKENKICAYHENMHNR